MKMKKHERFLFIAAGLIIGVVLLFLSGCRGVDRLTGTKHDKEDKPNAFYVVSCCRDNNNGILTYPSFVPSAHAQLCQSIELACRTNNCHMGPDVYLPMHVDCGKTGDQIGDQYYKGKGY